MPAGAFRWMGKDWCGFSLIWWSFRLRFRGFSSKVCVSKWLLLLRFSLKDWRGECASSGPSLSRSAPLSHDASLSDDGSLSHGGSPAWSLSLSHEIPAMLASFLPVYRRDSGDGDFLSLVHTAASLSRLCLRTDGDGFLAHLFLSHTTHTGRVGSLATATFLSRRRLFLSLSHHTQEAAVRFALF